MGRIPGLFLQLLVVLHAGLLLWALTGLMELVLPTVPWPRVANPLLPRPMLLAHWFSVLAASLAFLAGYTAGWRHTPLAVALGYGAMAIVCFVETTQFLVHDGRWLAMALEYAAYLGIGIFLFRASPARKRFGG
ncbi:hypothetical protein Plav_3327 [Parvibaculum lavamentivorans DS-1]|uniref:Transmembrane protein n=1 Tax=Parvibaculum lavamentivorans (strain DS-1 / DSM 13023 / NCIMB 13966) TaxID=402881 RepID=A7HYE8_PARL1|nr:hypothetical protein [Parvibaculum lavamentivorans]ABS64931.1 hypothetical protein Plav_3327 [Parvibaculum lavamentivorans DS-1]